MIESGKFYKIISKECNGWFLGTDSEKLAEEAAKSMANDVDAVAVPIQDEKEINSYLEIIKKSVTFH
jgi:hypothetical protein